MNRQELQAHYLAQGYQVDELEDAILETAAHEAGHFVMAAMIGGCPRLVDIAPGEKRLGICGGTPFSSLYDLPKDVILAFTRDSDMRRIYEMGACGNIMHALAGGYGTYWTNADYDWLGSEGDMREALEMAGKVFADPESVIDAIESLCARIMSYKRVGAAVLNVANWLAEHVQPSDEEISCKYVETARRIGFARNRITQWIAAELDSGRHGPVCELVDRNGQRVYK